MSKPLCFVLMPFGEKKDAAGATIQFDAVYKDLIRPAIEAAKMEPIRADEEMTGGIIHKPMFERLILCEYAIADLTTANANVFYELGVRHAVRPWSTILIFAEGSRLPFDLGPLRGLPYTLGADGKPADPATGINAIAAQLAAAREAATDSPIYQLVDGFPEVDHTKTDVFRGQVRYSEQAKERLATARRLGADAVRAVEKELEPIADQEAGVVIDLFLSFRAVEAWNDMIALVEKMSKPLAATVIVQEQLGLALNRASQGDRAERVLLALLERRGPSPETYGILGRVYKDRWEAARRNSDAFTVRGLLDKAINAYRRGFEADWRDAYPGVNAVTLMTVRNPPIPEREELFPVVHYAVERKIARGKPDYWDYVTRLELAVLREKGEDATNAVADALACVREWWEAETTANNLRLIREARAERGKGVSWADAIEQALRRKAEDMGKPRG
jgi:MAP3K TRAFs-binding domain